MQLLPPSHTHTHTLILPSTHTHPYPPTHTHTPLSCHTHTLILTVHNHTHIIYLLYAHATTSFRANGEATTRLPSDPPSGAVKNFEFSDANGNYNVTAEQVAFEAVGLRFYNLPVTGADAWTSKQLAEFSPVITRAMSNGPVLVHCASGYRSSGYMTAYLAQQNNQCVSWALQQARRASYSFDVSSADSGVMNFFQECLTC